MQDKREIGLYIHIPFCKQKCNYCDFNSFPGRDSYIPAYFDAMKREILLYRDKLRGYTVGTVFIGGGTPSLVETRYIYEVINSIRQNMEIKHNAETSIETNPGTLSYEKLMSYRVMGINRLSIGLQAWQNRFLKKLGRIHTREEFADNFKEARKVGFKNINVDLIFGLPGQSLRDWAETLDAVTALAPEHLSCYSLKVEENTVFGTMQETGELEPLDDETDREMYYMAVEKLAKAGLYHYEISNFAKPGYECRHNLVYWNAEEYIGLGAGAHSYFEGKRYNNPYSLEGYTAGLQGGGLSPENVQEIGWEEQMSEYMILGLRLTKGISPSAFKSRFNQDIFSLYGDKFDSLKRKGLLEVNEDRIKLTSKGLDFANEVFVEFI